MEELKPDNFQHKSHCMHEKNLFTDVTYENFSHRVKWERRSQRVWREGILRESDLAIRPRHKYGTSFAKNRESSVRWIIMTTVAPWPWRMCPFFGYNVIDFTIKIVFLIKLYKISLKLNLEKIIIYALIFRLYNKIL